MSMNEKNKFCKKLGQFWENQKQEKVCSPPLPPHFHATAGVCVNLLCYNKQMNENIFEFRGQSYLSVTYIYK